MADACRDCEHFFTDGEARGLCGLKCKPFEAKSIVYWMNNAFYGSRKACKKFSKREWKDRQGTIE